MLKKKFKALHIAVFAVVLLVTALTSFTGAWYTDKVGNTGIDFGDLEMGSVQLGSQTLEFTSKTQDLDNIKLLPTMQIDIGEVSYLGTVNAYYKIEIVSSDIKNGSGQSYNAADEAELNNVLSQATIYNAVVPNGKIQAQSIAIPSSLGNKYQNATAKISVSLTVLQQPNLADALTPEAAKQAFEQAGM